MKEGRNNGSRMKERKGKKEENEGEEEGRKGDFSGYLVYKVIRVFMQSTWLRKAMCHTEKTM